MTIEDYNNYCAMITKNINVFNDTRTLSVTDFIEDTDRLKTDTHVYDSARIITIPEDKFNNNMKVKIVNCGTVNTAYRIKENNNRVAMLNFADAKKPGGWVEDGAPTQEENMCRCTNLYEALILDKCAKGYYSKNNVFHTIDHITESYTNTIIYSENVAVFKDDVTYDRVPVKYVDVITCPAPCGFFKNVENILIPRMFGIVKSAYKHGVSDIVLGAWGCGAFGQDPLMVANCFAVVLSVLPVFNSVVFAIRHTEGDERIKDSTVGIFETVLSEYFNIEG